MSSISSSVLLDWVGLATLFGFLAMGIDKALAAGGRSRISERTLWLTALLRGFLGVYAGGYVFHHKTSKMAFWGPVSVSAVLWMVAISLRHPF